MALICENVSLVPIGKGKKTRRVVCGHALGLHDPCSVEGCGCRRFEPHDVKERAALITDIAPDPVVQARATARSARLLRGLN